MAASGKDERTFVMVKPDGVRRGLIGEVLARYERKGLKIVAARLLRVSRDLAERHYEEHRTKPFFEELVRFVTSGPVLALAIEGRNAVAVVRALNGATKPWEAGPGTVRGDFALALTPNVVHASDSLATARRELDLYFRPEDFHPYERTDEAYL